MVLSSCISTLTNKRLLPGPVHRAIRGTCFRRGHFAGANAKPNTKPLGTYQARPKAEPAFRPLSPSHLTPRLDVSHCAISTERNAPRMPSRSQFVAVGLTLYPIMFMKDLAIKIGCGSIPNPIFLPACGTPMIREETSPCPVGHGLNVLDSTQVLSVCVVSRSPRSVRHISPQNVP